MELLTENAEVWELWIEVQTQWRAGGIGVIGLDYHAVYAEAARLEIELSPCVMKKIKALESFTLKRLNDDLSKFERRGGSGKGAEKRTEPTE